MEVDNNIDAELHLADWVKKTWDLPTKLDEFKLMHPDSSSLKMYMFKLLYLPIGRSMPQTLIDELREEFGQAFVPKSRDKNTKDEKKDVYSGSASSIVATPLHNGMAGRREELRIITRQRRRMRTRRVIKYKLPDKKED
jgi:hypothetical protein